MLKFAVVPVTDFQQNCRIVYNETTKSGVVVDPGGNVDRIAAEIEKLGVNVQAIWLTHGHLDHAGAAEKAKSEWGVEIVGPHEADKMLLDNIVAAATAYNLTGYENATPDRWLNEGDTVSIDDIEFEVLHCPGHSPGHIVFVNHANQLILMGDVLFQGSIGRTDLPGGNHAQLLESIKTKLLTLDDAYQFHPGHSPASTIGQERRSNPFLQGLG